MFLSSGRVKLQQNPTTKFRFIKRFNIFQDCTLYHHYFNDASRPSNKANPQGISINKGGEVLFAKKVPTILTTSSSSNSLAKATAGLMRYVYYRLIGLHMETQ